MVQKFHHGFRPNYTRKIITVRTLRNYMLFCVLLAMPSSVTHSLEPADDVIPLDCPQIQQRKSKYNPFIQIYLITLPYEPYGEFPALYDPLANINPKKTYEAKRLKEQPLASCFSIPWRIINKGTDQEWIENRVRCKNNYTASVYWLEADYKDMSYKNNYPGEVFKIAPRGDAVRSDIYRGYGGEETIIRYGDFKNDHGQEYVDSAYNQCFYIIEDKNGKAMCSPRAGHFGEGVFRRLNTPMHNKEKEILAPRHFQWGLKEGRGMYRALDENGKWHGLVESYGISRFNVYQDTVIAMSYKVIDSGFYCAIKKTPKLGF
jgi:hypothetical protein